MPKKLITLLREQTNNPKQISFANHAGDYAPGTNNVLEKGSPTQIELVLLNLADAAAAQSAKGDLGRTYAEKYSVIAGIEMQVNAATLGSVIEFYWSHSVSSVAAVGNTGGASGVAAAYAGYSADLGTAIKQLILIGTLVMTDDLTADNVQIGYIGDLYPPSRYGSLIVKNETGQKLCDRDDVESGIVFNPIIPELQT